MVRQLIIQHDYYIRVILMGVRMVMSENIPSKVDWYYWLTYTKQNGAKRVNETIMARKEEIGKNKERKE